MSVVLNCQQVKKDFKSFSALKGVSFKVKKGECFGLLGPNGAGKSTLIRLLYGSSPRTSGQISLLGFDPEKQGRQVRSLTGVVTQDNNLDKAMSVEENMIMYAKYMGVPSDQIADRVAELLDYMMLSHKKNEVIEALSGGMQRRLVFVRALLGQPQLIILDEPTTGLDPAVRQLLWRKVEELKDQGITVLLTTHYMDEAETLCDRLVVMDHGEIQAQGSPAELIREHCPGYVAFAEKQHKEALKFDSSEVQATEDDRQLIFRSMDLVSLTEMFRQSGVQPLLIRPTNLEDVFLQITGRELNDDA